LLLVYCVKGVVEQVKHYTPYILPYCIYFRQFRIEMGDHFGVEGFIFCPQTMISQPHKFIGKGIYIGRLLIAAAGTRMLQHTFNNAVSAFAVMVYLLLVLFNIGGEGQSLLNIAGLKFFFHFIDHLLVHFRKIVDEV